MTLRASGMRCPAARAIAVTAATFAVLTASAAPATVVWDHDRLSVDATAAPRAEVLKEVARQTGSQLHGVEHVHGRITLQLQQATLGAALRMLAGDNSYALVETPPARTGAPAKYALSFVGPGANKPTPDVMNTRQPVVVLVEDPATGRMVRQPQAAGPRGGYPSQVRPDERPVSVRVDLE